MNIITISSIEWILPTLAMLFSIRKHSHKDMLNIHITVDANDNKTKEIQQIINDIGFNGMKITLYSIDILKQHMSNKCQQCIMNTKFPLVSLGKLASYSYVPFMEKAFYLDSDLLIMNSKIDEFYDTDIEGKYAAVVEDYTNMFFGQQHLKEAGVSKYFNFGVALHNNKLILKDGLIDIINYDISHSNDALKFIQVDQTYFNKLFKENVKFMDPIFNYYSTLIGYPEYDLVAKQYGYWSQLDLVNKAVIVHFVGGAKPWLNDFYTWQSYQLPFRLWQKPLYDKNLNNMLTIYPKCKNIMENI